MPLVQRAVQRIYPVVSCSEDCLAKVTMLLEAGIQKIQWRQKESLHDLSVLHALVEVVQDFDALLVINDDIAQACAIKHQWPQAKIGVHLGRTDGSIQEARQKLGAGAYIGMSCQGDVTYAQACLDAGADLVSFGSAFQTSTKTHVKILPAGALEHIINQLRGLGYKQDLCVIGGINRLNIKKISELDIQYIAMSAALQQGSLQQCQDELAKIVAAITEVSVTHD